MPDATPTPYGRFRSTRWTLIQKAARHGEPGVTGTEAEEAEEALNELCGLYWPPIYAYARFRGKSREDAEDLTQTLFLELLDKRLLARADLGRTKFRTFLLARFNFVISNDFRQQAAIKRGRDVKVISADSDGGEELYQTALAHESDPAQAYDRAWAAALTRRTLVVLQREYTQGKPRIPFDDLRGYLPGGSAHAREPQRILKDRYGLPSEGAVKQVIQRLNKRLREIFHALVADTVADPADVEEEIRHLLRLLAGR